MTLDPMILGSTSLRRAVTVRYPQRRQEQLRDNSREKYALGSSLSRPFSPGTWNSNSSQVSTATPHSLRRSSHSQAHDLSAPASVVGPSFPPPWPGHTRQLAVAREQRRALQGLYPPVEGERGMAESTAGDGGEAPSVEEAQRAIKHAGRHDFLESISPIAVAEASGEIAHSDGGGARRPSVDPVTPLTPVTPRKVAFEARGEGVEADATFETDTESLYSMDALEVGNPKPRLQQGVGVVGVPSLLLASKVTAEWRYNAFPALSGQRKRLSGVARR